MDDQPIKFTLQTDTVCYSSSEWGSPDFLGLGLSFGYLEPIFSSLVHTAAVSFMSMSSTTEMRGARSSRVPSSSTSSSPPMKSCCVSLWGGGGGGGMYMYVWVWHCGLAFVHVCVGVDVCVGTRVGRYGIVQIELCLNVIPKLDTCDHCMFLPSQPMTVNCRTLSGVW